jgi:hypothetical protein
MECWLHAAIGLDQACSSERSFSLQDFPSPKAPQCTTAVIPRLQSLWFQKRTIDLCDTPEVTFTYSLHQIINLV